MAEQRPLAVITGAASGLGLECARILAGEGYALALLDVAEATLRDAATALEQTGAEVHPLVVDVADEASVESAFARIAQFGGLRALVNSAGISSLGTIEDTDIATWDRMTAVKLRGQFLTCKAAIPLMKAGGGGAIVNVSSMSGRTKSVLTSPAYAAANAGIIGLTMTVAAQSVGFGVRVNCVAPGVIDTPILRMYPEEQLASMVQAIPIGRMAAAREVAEVVTFLLSDKASYITGETVNVNGGMFMV